MVWYDMDMYVGCFAIFLHLSTFGFSMIIKKELKLYILVNRFQYPCWQYFVIIFVAHYYH